MPLRRTALSFLLLTGLCLGALSPAQAAEDPRPTQKVVDTLVAGLAGGATGRSDSDPTSPTVPTTQPLAVDSTPAEAQAALDEVADLFQPHVSSRVPALEDGGDATMALRDLTLRSAALSTDDRIVSTRSNDRPWDTDFPRSRPKCAANICVHWISQSDADTFGPEIYHATDGGIDISRWVSQESYVKTVLDTLVQVSRTYSTAGYRQPRADSKPGLTLGGGSQTDIYLTDPGASGRYGYCTVDGSVDSRGDFHPTFPASRPGRSTDLPAFCVLDNDYRPGQFGTRNTPLDNLRVTAAHEYFHAIQFAYDYLEDRWFMEATATWAEDQVYDGINDNLQYLRASQLRHPAKSLDDDQALNGFLHYGDWIWFEYLSERLPTRTGIIPNVVLQMWQRADSVTGPDQYSLQAIVSTLAARGASFPRLFAQYAAGNRHPATTYAEGRANHYPAAPLQRTVRLQPTKRQAAGSVRLDHLTSATVRFVPKRTQRRSTRLAFDLDMASRRAGSAAVVTTYLRNGRITTKVVRLNKAGNGHAGAPFSSRRVRAVELTLVNASARFTKCTSQVDAFSCGGTPVDDGRLQRYSARVR